MVSIQRSRDLILRCDSEISNSYFPDFFGDFCWSTFLPIRWTSPWNFITLLESIFCGSVLQIILAEQGNFSKVFWGDQYPFKLPGSLNPLQKSRYFQLLKMMVTFLCFSGTPNQDVSYRESKDSMLLVCTWLEPKKAPIVLSRGFCPPWN